MPLLSFLKYFTVFLWLCYEISVRFCIGVVTCSSEGVLGAGYDCVKPVKSLAGILHLHKDKLMKLDFIYAAQFLTKLPEDLSADLLFKSIEAIKMSVGKQKFGQILAGHIQRHSSRWCRSETPEGDDLHYSEGSRLVWRDGWGALLRASAVEETLVEVFGRKSNRLMKTDLSYDETSICDRTNYRSRLWNCRHSCK